MTRAEELPTVEEQRAQLSSVRIDAVRRHRILFVGRFFQGPTGIVASLGRALESLGHTVFQLDVSRHPEVLDKSSGAKGGYGPVFVQVDEMSAVLATFRPQVVVFCAGGMVLNDDAAASLRARGIVSIGLTLSDPDVQPSVIDWVRNFDIHTTNAQIALEQYEASGIHNTFLFPFGIDRGYVLQDVPEDPSLAADAICIGHASGREDRHEVMVPLAARVNVRTYGHGWPLPGSYPVSGDKLVQAARAGTVHVNFPATRAGYTNVKCGVFESVGVGAIVATTPFDEMAQLFEYGEEIIGYETAEDLADAILELKADPARLEAMRRRAFRRLVDEHLYEHRWNQLFSAVYGALDAPSSAVTSLPEWIGRVLGTEAPPPRTVLLSGYYGAANRGDDLLLEAIAGGLERGIPGAQVVVAGVNPRYVEKVQGRQSFLRTHAAQAERWAAGSAAVVLGGGGLWHDYTIQKAGGAAGIITGTTLSPAHLVQLPLLVRAYGGSFHGFGLGVGPLSDPAAIAAVRLSGQIAESITVRDQESADILRQIPDWGGAVDVAPDAVYGLPLPEARGSESDRPYIAVNVRPWRESGADLLAVRDAVFDVAQRHGLDVLGVPMQKVDEVELSRWADGESGTRFTVLPHDIPLEEFLGALSGARALVAFRLHANLLAHRLGVSCVGISYDPKVRAHFEEIGREDMVADLPLDADALADLVDRAVVEAGLPEGTRTGIRQLEAAAGEAIAGLAARVALAPSRVAPAGMVRTVGTDDQAPTKGASSSAPWPESEALDLRQGVVTSGNVTDASRKVTNLHRRRGTAVLFEMQERAPRRGDYVQWALRIPATPGEGVRAELWIQQKYGERPQFRGRLAYEVLADGEVIFAQDVVEWQPRNTVWVARRAQRDHVEISVRLVALRDCENWNWGKATTMTIEAARSLPWDGGSDLAWGASSPYAVRTRPDIETEPDGVSGVEVGGEPRVETRLEQGPQARTVPTSTTQAFLASDVRRLGRGLTRRARRLGHYLTGG